jgi:hypothetical protein
VTSVTNLGDGIFSVNTGNRTIIVQDSNNDGRVDKIAYADQSDAEVLFGELGKETNTLLGEWGDPHLHSRHYDKQAAVAMNQSADNLYKDIKDGRLDDANALSAVVTQLESGGKRNEIADAHADHTLKNGSMSAVIDVKVADWNPNFAVTENAYFNFGAQVVAIKNVWKETATDGDLSVEARANSSNIQSKATFVHVDASNGTSLGIEGTTKSFDTSYRGKYILDINGKMGQVKDWDMDWVRQDYMQRNYSVSAIVKRDDDDKAKQANAAEVWSRDTAYRDVLESWYSIKEPKDDKKQNAVS